MCKSFILCTYQNELQWPGFHLHNIHTGRCIEKHSGHELANIISMQQCTYFIIMQVHFIFNQNHAQQNYNIIASTRKAMYSTFNNFHYGLNAL